MRIDIMTDIETLGNNSDATIFQIAAIAFNIQTGEYYEKFNMIADISKNKHMNIMGSTLKWWLNTNKELLTELLNKGSCSSKELVYDFHKWLECLSGITNNSQNIYLWGNGILFDNKILQYQMQNQGLNYPIFYRNDRDMRTLVELARHKIEIATEKELREKLKSKTLIEHDALNDVMGQIEILSQCYNILMNNK